MEKYKSEVELPALVDDVEPLASDSAPYGHPGYDTGREVSHTLSHSSELHYGPAESGGLGVVPASRLLKHAEEYRKKGDTDLATYFENLARV